MAADQQPASWGWSAWGASRSLDDFGCEANDRSPDRCNKRGSQRMVPNSKRSALPKPGWLFHSAMRLRASGKKAHFSFDFEEIWAIFIAYCSPIENKFELTPPPLCSSSFSSVGFHCTPGSAESGRRSANRPRLGTICTPSLCSTTSDRGESTTGHCPLRRLMGSSPLKPR